MKKWLKRYIPSTSSLPNPDNLKGFKSFFKASCFWSRDHQSVARGVAAGLAGAVIPGFQIFYAAILVILLRGNLPIALLCTFITNPLTVAPITYFIYFVGKSIIQYSEPNLPIRNFQWNIFHISWSNASTWILQFGKAFIVGVPIVSIFLGLIGYCGTILIWKIYTYFK